jgi:hypothetical protein
LSTTPVLRISDSGKPPDARPQAREDSGIWNRGFNSRCWEHLEALTWLHSF